MRAEPVRAFCVRMTDKQLMITACHTAETILANEGEDIFNADHSVVFAFDELGFLREVARATDVYQALQSASLKVFEEKETGIVLTSCGWASPITDGAPSEHPDRSRCSLVVAMDRFGEAVSLVKIQGKEEIEPEAPGEGPMAQAMMHTLLVMNLLTMEREHRRRKADVKE